MRSVRPLWPFVDHIVHAPPSCWAIIVIRFDASAQSLALFNFLIFGSIRKTSTSGFVVVDENHFQFFDESVASDGRTLPERGQQWSPPSQGRFYAEAEARQCAAQHNEQKRIRKSRLPFSRDRLFILYQKKTFKATFFPASRISGVRQQLLKRIQLDPFKKPFWSETF